MTVETKERRWEVAELPEAIYGCATEHCAAEFSFPPDMLRWFEGYEAPRFKVEPGWYCTEQCISELSSEAESLISEGEMPEIDVYELRGPTLAEELVRRAA